jgi:6,7-dimethyl-8-ribityllumazine synthase
MGTPRIIDGNLSAKDLRVGIVAARFNGFIVERLVAGAVDTLCRLGADAAQITVAHCPGAFEIPQVAKRLVETNRFHVVICLGCVIRGATPHFDYVAAETAKGVAQLGLSSKIPVTFGVLTTDNIEQAVERAGTKAGNKGADAALAAVELASIFEQIGQIAHS